MSHQINNNRLEQNASISANVIPPDSARTLFSAKIRGSNVVEKGSALDFEDGAILHVQEGTHVLGLAKAGEITELRKTLKDLEEKVAKLEAGRNETM